MIFRICLLFTLLVTRPVSADSLSDHINAFIAEKQTPGLVLMVVKDGQVLRHEAFGVADLATQTPMRTDAIFRFYSMSKPITAVALLQLIDAGKLQLNTSLHSILPVFADQPPITMQQLLTHTAGFGYGGSFDSFTGLRYFWVNPMDQEGKTLAESMQALASLPPLHEPGTAWTYGMASDVQGAVIEQVTGQPLPQYLQQHVFLPLGMTDTGFYVQSHQRARLTAQHDVFAIPFVHKWFYRDDDVTEASTLPPKLVSGGGGLVGTVADYMKFAQWLLQEPGTATLLSAALREQMLQNQLPAGVGRLPDEVYSNSGYGFGLGVKLVDEAYLSQGSVYWAGKGGSLFWVDRKRKLAVVAAMPLTGAARGLEKRLVPWVYEWLQEPSRRAAH
ncbi:MAG: serine hydrolase domain-containing protein [Pseudomonadota bacterium]